MDAKHRKVKILGPDAVKAKLRRMAYEIYEKNFEQEHLVMIGIGKRGGYIATQLAATLREISPLKVELYNAAKTDGDGIELTDKACSQIAQNPVLIVDDVLYSGLTMFHAVAAVMENEPTTLQTAVLIDRGHRNVPVTHDYVGLELATSLKQYVSVEIAENENKALAYLF